MITAVFVAALMQSAAIDRQRENYLACLKTGIANAKANKMAAGAFEAYIRQTCAAVETTFQASMIAFDVKNKVPRKQAASDAKLQINDFVTASAERYRLMTTPR